jgi:GrpB-like predicted nucleotidyltransferase (UPF0157 family)
VTGDPRTDPGLHRSARVRVVPYEGGWPTAFEAEAAVLAACLGAADPVLEHVGSTAVVGLSAKPITEILVGVADPWTAGLAEALQGAGYVYTPESEADDSARRVFRKGPPPPLRTHHVHVTELHGVYWRRIIAFRDWLRSHPDDAGAYASLKASLAAAYPASPRDYSRSKSAFVRTIEARAMAGAASSEPPRKVADRSPVLTDAGTTTQRRTAGR